MTSYRGLGLSAVLGRSIPFGACTRRLISGGHSSFEWPGDAPSGDTPSSAPLTTKRTRRVARTR